MLRRPWPKVPFGTPEGLHDQVDVHDPEPPSPIALIATSG
ncbi:hypothetical protein FB382_001709 [Nocardioides ginsengisegetis]|uniref:Uncharacterized protein n=1 Tax=Nocardioides ginsengisegetis TaxID=661491 RepID=A0A7W3IZE8_9ACTN|nr:hypothetical protein [Nocardioides ginsengisegetis]